MRSSARRPARRHADGARQRADTRDRAQPRMSGAKKPPLRTFLALWPDAAVRAQLAERSATAARACAGRAPPPDTLHLTLVFIGTTPAGRIGALSAMREGLDA